MINKREFSIIQLEILKPLLEFDSQYCSKTISNTEIVYTDAAIDSNFHFVISLQDFKQQKETISISFQPATPNKISGINVQVKSDKISDLIDNWINLLITYNDFPIGNDPILEDYTNQYYDEFTLVDDPSNDKPLLIHQALLLDQYLKTVEDEIVNFYDEDNQESVEEIRRDISNLRRNITNISKSEIVKKLSIISAKLTKAGLNFVKEFLNEAKKEGIKRLLGWVIENGPNVIEGMANHFKSH